MNLFQIQEIDLEPILIMAKSRKEAIAEFHFALLRTFGFIPNMNFALLESDAELFPNSKELQELLDENQLGFASPSHTGWRRTPFDDEG